MSKRLQSNWIWSVIAGNVGNRSENQIQESIHIHIYCICLNKEAVVFNDCPPAGSCVVLSVVHLV